MDWICLDRVAWKRPSALHPRIPAPQYAVRAVNPPAHFHRAAANHHDHRIRIHPKKLFNKPVLFIGELHICPVIPFTVMLMVQAANENHLAGFLRFRYRLFPKPSPVQRKRFLLLTCVPGFASAVFKTVCLPVHILIFLL